MTATMEGASPIVLPRLMSDVRIAGIAVYPDEPSISEEAARGILSGTRTETATIMAEDGASGRVPGIELRWFNLKSGSVEAATVDGFDISVQGPPASRRARERSMLVPAAVGLATLVALATLTLLIRRFWPRARDAHRRRQARRRASKAWAEHAMLKAIQKCDYHATLRALDEWASRPPATDPSRLAPVHGALTGIGRSIYGRAERKPQPEEWRAVSQAVKEALAGPSRSMGNSLPPLNPGVAIG